MGEREETEEINLEIPRVSDSPLRLTLGPGDRLYVVGANGSGKSALIQFLISSLPGTKVRRISAHRQTWLQSGSIDFTPRRRREFDRQLRQNEANTQARWRDFHGHERQSAVLYDLVAKENARARSITRHVDAKALEKAVEESSESEPPFKQLNELLRLGTLAVSLENTNDEEIIAQHQVSGAAFSITQMSDGERNAAIIAATVLTVDEGTTILIDEPERHLHRSIIEPFLSALFQRRSDCTFVVSTHEISLPVAHRETRSLIVRSCNWNGEVANAWDVDLLEADTELPEDLKRAILGSRQRILFVEGDDANSMDLPLYSALYEDISIVPKGGFNEVVRAVKGLRDSESLHRVEAFGLIDRDNRQSYEVSQLATEHVYALNVFSAEAMYYCSDAIAAVALRQAESLGRDSNDMLESATRAALDALHGNDVAKRMAARRCERTVRNQIGSRLPNWKDIIGSTQVDFQFSVASPFPSELERFRKLLSNNELDELVARYPLRETSALDAISRTLELASRELYQQTLIARVRNDAALAQKLKERIGPLSIVLCN